MTPSILLLFVTAVNSCFLLSLLLKKKDEAKKVEVSEK